MNVEAVTPRGFCHGVVDALGLVTRAARDPKTVRPIFVLGMLVHNHHVVEELAELGVTTLDGPHRLDLLAEVPDGATVIFTAHGVSPAVRARAEARKLHVIDATCSEVTKTHEVIREYARQGYRVVYVGTRNHPEPAGAMGNVPPEQIALVTELREVSQVPFSATDDIVVATQTTLSQWDTAEIITAITARYPQALVFNEICLATQLRQQAIYEASGRVEAVIVVGDARSNNTRKLAEVAQHQGGLPAFRVDRAEDLQALDLSPYQRIAVTAGSSTPSVVTRQVIKTLKESSPRGH